MDFKLKCRRIQESDLNTLLSWNSSLQKEKLPLDGCGGFVVEKDGHLIAANWMVLNDNHSEFGIIYEINNQLYQDVDKNQAVELLNDFTNFIGTNIINKED